MKIVECELHHVSEDATGSIVLAVLTATRADGTHYEFEVRLPEEGAAGQEFRRGWNAALENVRIHLPVVPLLKSRSAAEGT